MNVSMLRNRIFTLRLIYEFGNCDIPRVKGFGPIPQHTPPSIAAQVSAASPIYKQLAAIQLIHGALDALLRWLLRRHRPH
jgi:hypothetical protein